MPTAPLKATPPNWEAIPNGGDEAKEPHRQEQNGKQERQGNRGTDRVSGGQDARNHVESAGKHKQQKIRPIRAH
jgi:hypothetical protein